MKFSEEWELLSVYEKFEKLVCIVLSLFIAVIILFALYKLGHHLVTLLVKYGFDPLEHKAFKEIFGMIMTLLIALEFKHSIVKVVVKNESIVQVKTVLLIAILAIARKMIILDTKAMSAMTIFSLAGVLFALGLVYWLMRERDDRICQDKGDE
jgi:uncharacterized membrane protein (DUF373 family)